MTGGSSAGGGAAGMPTMHRAGSPYDDLGVKPDVDTSPVDSCTAKNDLTLCNIETAPDRFYDICLGGVCVSPGCGNATCNVPAPHFVPPPAHGHEFFTLLAGDEPVAIDLVTGLHWQSCIAGTRGAACDDGTPELMDWNRALAYCDELSWGGKEDWYLPDSYELFSIADYAEAGYALNQAFFPGNTVTAWTSHAVNDTDAFTIGFDPLSTVSVATVDSQPRTDTSHVRCVRRGFSRDTDYAGQRFVTNNPGPIEQKVIEDHATRLLWQGCVMGRTADARGTCSGHSTDVPAEEWAGLCESLVWAGFDDWRLPTYKELHSIAQYPSNATTRKAEVDDSLFDIGDSPYFGMSSGPGEPAPHVLFDRLSGNKVGANAENTYPVVCVRWM